MDITFKNIRDQVAELRIDVGNAKLTETISEYIGGKEEVPEEIIKQILSVAFECTRFNKTSDVDTVMKIVEAFLNDAEQAELLERLGDS